MAELKPAYLISGEDDSKIDARRLGLRKRVSEEAPEATLEVLRDDPPKPEAAAEAITALTLSTGRRYVLVEGVQKWKAPDVKEVEAALSGLPVDTVVVFIAQGDPPKGLDKAVEACGGEVRNYDAPSRGKYSSWTRERASDLGLNLDRDAVEALLARVPRDDKNRLRQRSLIRELEKLATYAGEGAAVDAGAVEQLTGSSVDARMYELADAVIDGDRAFALSLAERLRSQGEDMMYILFALLRQIRNAHRAWAMVNSGKSVGEVQSELHVPQFVARRIVSQVKNLDGHRFERALELLADLDWEIRGGGNRDQDTALTLMLAGSGGADAAG